MCSHVNPPGGHGHYSTDGSRWWDEAKGYWFPIMLERDEAEIALEPAGGGCSRFVARATSTDRRWPAYGVTGDSFPAMRMQPFDKLDRREPFSADARASLDRLREDLELAGWLPNGRGEHWWSYRYTRPAVDWDRPLGGGTREPIAR
jgi:hypothetical protein